MSQTLVAVAIDLDRLTTLVAPGNAFSFPEGLSPSAQEWLTQLRTPSAVENPQGDNNSEFGYALVELAELLGERLNLPELEDVRGIELFEAAPWMASGSPVPLPMYPDFPFIGFLPRGDIDRTINAAKETLAQAADESTAGFLDGLLTGYHQAKRMNRDLFGSYY
jgi:hypothetical protein